MTGSDKKKTPGFGIGPKHSKERMKACQRDLPAPNNYELASSFEQNKNHNKGNSFGITHDHYKKVYNKCLPEKKGWTEPGLYNIRSFVDINKQDSKKLSFGARREFIPSKTPGPGHYKENEREALNRFGRYANGKNKNSMSR